MLTLGVLGALTGVCLWSVVFLLGLSGLSEHRAQAQLYGDLRGQVSASGTGGPVGGVIEPGRPVAVLDVASVGLHRLVVVEGTAAGDLQKGPGHLRSTPLPGQAGLAVVYGRSATWGAPFARVPDLRTGATITATTQQGTFRYVVDGVRRAGDLTPANLSTSNRLVLVTSEGTLGPEGVVYVDATLQGDPAVAPAGPRSATTLDERAMATESGVLTSLVLWLEGLLLVVVGAPLLARRWAGPQAWLVSVPVLLVVLWGTSATASRLLPNLF